MCESISLILFLRRYSLAQEDTIETLIDTKHEIETFPSVYDFVYLVINEFLFFINLHVFDLMVPLLNHMLKIPKLTLPMMLKILIMMSQN